jgi:hypothetical protein
VLGDPRLGAVLRDLRTARVLTLAAVAWQAGPRRAATHAPGAELGDSYAALAAWCHRVSAPSGGKSPMACFTSVLSWP